jgi:hypothetical protein
VDASDLERASIAGAAMLALAHPDFRNDMRQRNTDGTHALIPALIEDPMSRVFAAVERQGGTSYLVTREAGVLRIVVVTVLKSPPVDGPVPNECPIDGNAPVGMVLAYLRDYGRLVCHEAMPDMDLEVVDSTPGPLVTA